MVGGRLPLSGQVASARHLQQCHRITQLEVGLLGPVTAPGRLDDQRRRHPPPQPPPPLPLQQQGRPAPQPQPAALPEAPPGRLQAQGCPLLDGRVVVLLVLFLIVLGLVVAPPLLWRLCCMYYKCMWMMLCSW